MWRLDCKVVRLETDQWQGVLQSRQEIAGTLTGAMQIKDRRHNISKVKLTCFSDCFDMRMEDMIQRFLACMTGKWWHYEDKGQRGRNKASRVLERCSYSTWSNFETINILFKFKSNAKRTVIMLVSIALIKQAHQSKCVQFKGLICLLNNVTVLHLWGENPLLCRGVAEEIKVANNF